MPPPKDRLQVLAGDVQAVGRLEHRRIAVRGADQRHDDVVFGQFGAAQFEWFADGAPDRLDRGFVTQDLLDRAWDQ